MAEVGETKGARHASEQEGLGTSTIGFRARLSRVRAMALSSIGIPRGFFTQYRYASQVDAVSEPYPEVESVCAASPWRDFLAGMQECLPQVMAFGGSARDPILGRGMFPAMDGIAAYAAVRKYKPRQVLEIGSGDSTYFLAKGIEDNEAGRLTCIDPQPRRAISNLDINLERRLMTGKDIEIAETMEPNDILFIDSSHIMLPGMDVDIQFNRIFPRLNTGIVVHLHDIFLPDYYPPNWRVRNYSEQNSLIGWILSGYFEVILPAQYVYTRHRNNLVTSLGIIDNLGSGGSIWLRRKG